MVHMRVEDGKFVTSAYSWYICVYDSLACRSHMHVLLAPVYINLIKIYQINTEYHIVPVLSTVLSIP